jgi:uncharacterized protein (DUF4415 family)
MLKTTKTRSGRVLVMPSDEEDAAITAAALSDPDNQPLSDEQLAQFKRRPGRPASSCKQQVTLRLDADVLESFKSGGEGWQTRINAALKDWVQHH